MFASLHNHTYASNIRFLDSINRPEDMVEKAIKLGFKGIAFTDHEALSAAISILKIRDSIEKEHPDFKIIFGNEIYLIDESEIKNTRDYYHFILLAKDKVGWDQIRALSSRAWERSYSERGIVRTPTTYQDIEEIIGVNPGHIYASSGCLGGIIPKKILAHDVHGTNEIIQWCIKIFGKEYFSLELQPSDNEEQIIVNNTLIKLANHYQIKYIVTSDSHYLNKEDFKIHSAFLNSKSASDRETEKFYKYTYIMEEEEMREVLKAEGLGISDEEINQAFENTCKISDNIEVYDFRHSTIVPEIQLPEFKLSGSLNVDPEKYPSINDFYESPYEQDLFLMYQIEQGVIEKNMKITTEILNRVNEELDILGYISDKLNQRLSAYFNLTKDTIEIAWNVSFSCAGRGSACGELINYLIGITQVNPLDYDLPEWRFLNRERAELPDIDVDYAPEQKDNIIKLLREKYGEDNVLNCATFKTMSLKAAILSCGRGLGFNNDDMQALAALVPAHRGKTYTLKQCLEGDEEQGFEPVPNFKNKLDLYPGLFDAIKKIEGLPTNASIHASALYVFNNGYLPQNALMRAPNKVKITAFNMHDSDDMGALKMDVLLTDAQSKMMKCMDLLLKDKQIEWQGNLKKTYTKYLHPDTLEYDDPEMWRKACDGEISNLFQLETPVGAVCVKKARPANVRELAEINSIMRLQSEGEQPIDRYVRLKEDPEVWDLEMIEEGLTPHEMELMHKYLDASHGVSSSQEVLMRILMDPEITDFTLGEANSARKAIAKKQTSKLIKLKEDFFKKGLAA